MTNQLTEKFKAFWKRRELSANKKSEPPATESKAKLEKPLSVAYQVMGDKSVATIDFFGGFTTPGS